MEQTVDGILLTILAGALGGSTFGPWAYIREWSWENKWLLYSVFAYFIFPVSIAVWTIPNLMEVYTGVGSQPIILTMLFGFGWGLAVVLFGLGVDMVGLGLTGGIIYGTSVAVGFHCPAADSRCQ